MLSLNCPGTATCTLDFIVDLVKNLQGNLFTLIYVRDNVGDKIQVFADKKVILYFVK